VKKPLSPHARRVLANLPTPTLEINPGVTRKLVAEGLARHVSLPSPYPTHKGGNCDHLEAVPEPEA
jgi:hypothetical protein